MVRENSWLNHRGQEILDELNPFLIKKVEQSEWPGTRLISGEATVFVFEYCEDVKDILSHAVDGLYQWTVPLPEDLCLLRGEEPWLVSIAHEADAYLLVEHHQADQILERHAGLGRSE